MKKLLISMLFSCGVGLTMMGSPALVNDDVNDQNSVVVTNCESLSSTNGSMAVVPEQPNKPMYHGRLGLKHKCNKRVDVSKYNAPKRVRSLDDRLVDHLVDPIDLDRFRIKKDPFTPKPGGPINHGNTEPKKPIIYVDR